MKTRLSNFENTKPVHTEAPNHIGTMQNSTRPCLDSTLRKAFIYCAHSSTSIRQQCQQLMKFTLHSNSSCTLGLLLFQWFTWYAHWPLISTQHFTLAWYMVHSQQMCWCAHKRATSNSPHAIEWISFQRHHKVANRFAILLFRSATKWKPYKQRVAKHSNNTPPC